MKSKPPNGPPGYGNPPRANQFKPGQSGNPRGRPKDKKSQTIHDAVRKRLQEPVTLIINGKRQTMTRAELIVTQLLNKASNADLKATETLIKLERNSPAPDLLSELGGAADQLAQRLRLIQERRKKRMDNGEEESHQALGDETPAVMGDIVEIEKPRDGIKLDGQGGVSAAQVHSADIASNPDNHSQLIEGGGSGAASESSHHSVKRMKNEE